MTEQRNININQSNSHIGVSYAEKVNAQNIGPEIHNYASEQKQNLVEAAKEIQDLLSQLENSYPTETSSQNTILARKTIEKIENNPTLKERIIAAIRDGGVEALTELIDHPAVKVLKSTLEGWKTPNG